ncbi:MAG TPA: S1C family serine protease [Candidatus Andersenbacteria bacterium]|nr:S1C family serine protease [Candidatus Andersenbacteria bacterium]
MDLEKSSQQGIVRISFGALLLGSAAVVVLGLLGGIAGSRFFPARQELLREPGTRDQLISTVQEVTISPNQAAAVVVSNVERAVVLLRERSEESDVLLGTGVVVTNDGLVVTSASLDEREVIATDYRGQELAVDFVGQDTLYGLSYLRINEAVLPTLDLHTERVSGGTRLIAVSRNETTLQARSAPFDVFEHTLPPELAAKGIQRLLRGSTEQDDRLAGSPLVDEESAVAAILLNPRLGLALPADLLRQSLDRVIGGAREANPLNELGLGLDYSFVREGENPPAFTVEVISVAPASSAAEAGLARGDRIVSIAGEAASWEQSVVGLLSRQRPLTLVVRRGTVERSVTLN